MKVDTNPFEVSSSFTKLVFISANVARIEADHVANIERMKWVDELELNHFENVERSIYPIVGESLLDFLSRQCDAKGDMSLCPKCNAMSDRNARAFERCKLECKIAHKEAKKEWLKRKVARKQKMFDFGPFDPKYVKLETRSIK